MMLSFVSVPVVGYACVVGDYRLVVSVFRIYQCLVAVLVGDLLSVATEVDINLVTSLCSGHHFLQCVHYSAVCRVCVLQTDYVFLFEV